MMVGHCHSHPHHHHHHQHRIHRAGSDSSRDEQYTNGSSSSNTASSSDYSLAMSSEVGDRSSLHHSTASLIDSIERRTQRTYRYGIGLVCLGATLNWLGFAQGTTYIEPLRYFGITCVLTGSFCVCLAMCRWLGRPISVSGHHVTNLEEERAPGDVHVINVPVPLYVPSLHEEYRPQKPPDYEQIVAGEPPPYDEAIKLSPGAFFGPPHHSNGIPVDTGRMYVSHQLAPSSPCQASPSHSHHHHHHLHYNHMASNDLSRALLLDHQDNLSMCGSGAPTPTPPSHPTPSHYHPSVSLLTRTDSEGSDPPPAYEPSPRPSISSCSSSAPLIPTATSRFELPPSFSVRRLFGGVTGAGVSINSSAASPNGSPRRRMDHYDSSDCNDNEHLQEQMIVEESSSTYSQQQQAFVPNTTQNIGSTTDDLNGNNSMIV